MTSIWFRISTVIWLVTELWIAYSTHRNQEGRDADRGSRLVIVGCILLAIIGGQASYTVLPRFPIRSAALMAPLGSIMILAGVAFRVWSVRVLGAFFTTNVMIHEGQRVVREGPYRFLRHPSYAGSLFSVLGCGIAINNWPSLALMLVLTSAGLLWRIRVEEGALRQALGTAYTDYARQTKRLIPGVW
ncbi:MAG: methyltransferase family protein [Candidatus Dormibacteria bacterium]